MSSQERTMTQVFLWVGLKHDMVMLWWNTNKRHAILTSARLATSFEVEQCLSVRIVIGRTILCGIVLGRVSISAVSLFLNWNLIHMLALTMLNFYDLPSHTNLEYESPPLKLKTDTLSHTLAWVLAAGGSYVLTPPLMSLFTTWEDGWPIGLISSFAGGLIVLLNTNISLVTAKQCLDFFVHGMADA